MESDYHPCYVQGGEIINPTTGETEIIDELVFNPYGSVLTDAGHYLWAGPTDIGAIFTIPGTDEVPELPELPPDNSVTPPFPGRPYQAYRAAVPAITYTITGHVFGPDPDEEDDDIDPPFLGIECNPACGGATGHIAFTFEPSGETRPDGLDGAAGRDAEVIRPPQVSGSNRFVENHNGAWGASGDSGWGIEICFFGCWTIGEAADPGQPGHAAAPVDHVLTTAETNGDLYSTADNAAALVVTSRGGNGGSGGNAWGALPAAGGGAAGVGGNVEVDSHVDITTSGAESHGMFIQSRAGSGGTGGSGYIFSSGAGGGQAAQGGTATARNHGDIITSGDGAVGVYAQSLGGGGGTGGDSYGLVGDAGTGSPGGHGGAANATNFGTVRTGDAVAGTGYAAHGVFAQSVGGPGGNAGDSGALVVGLGGDGADGGNGGNATATNATGALIVTQGSGAVGLYAQSIGGGGGDGGYGVGIAGIGGTGAGGGNGGTATANNELDANILTTGSAAYGVLAQSVGGGGGNGGNGNGIGGIGATGAGGGQGGQATINNRGFVETRGDYSHGLLAQSIGGGGGAGGNGNGLVGLGGGGATARTDNHGGRVDLTNHATGAVLTSGEGAVGIYAQSIGGGGGTGAGSGGLVAVGGSGSAGGDGRVVNVRNDGAVETHGVDAKGIVAQSIGGGGGSASRSHGAADLGGSGGAGGNGGHVTVRTGAGSSIVTGGAGADGILAQSIGGGGGSGASTGGVGGLGGTGTGGGSGGQVTVVNDGSIDTGYDIYLPGADDRTGSRARGILAQSIGGGGGNGGDSGGLVAIGGDASLTSPAGLVEVTNNGDITTRGSISSAIEATSVGGGGGSGGSSTGVFVTIGGTGGGGGNGGQVHIENTGSLTTFGNDSHGIFAQSVGGGGGNGGNAASISLFGGVTVGGNGGGGGEAALVRIGSDNSAPGVRSIETYGDRAKGVLAQSIGGGGGNGGFAANVTLGWDGAASAAVGGAGGAGKHGGEVQVWNDWNIFTDGLDSDGIVAQSIGGSGGNGGFALAFGGTIGDFGAAAFAAGVGGDGGGGGDGRTVLMRAGGDIQTRGANSDGIIAQSIGGGGGTGGFALSFAAGGAGGAAASAAVSVGGAGGDGGNAGLVDVEYTGDIGTTGENSFGAVLQAVGGRGGTGGFTVAGAVSAGGAASASAAVGVGGDGGGAGNGGEVRATLTGNLETTGDRSTGLVAQSIGGAGGNGGFNISGVVSGSGSGTGGVAVGVGGAGGAGGQGGLVTATFNGTAVTRGDDADAVLMQSVGGGGGNGGMNTSGVIVGSGGGSGAVAGGGGGQGGDAGNAGEVVATVNGSLGTEGDRSNAFIAQSLGGGGGNGGLNVSGSVSGAGSGSGAVAVGVGGAGGGGGNGLAVTATLNGDAVTLGDDATAVIAQSVGGGGGNGGIAISGSLSASGGTSGAVAVGVGGAGGGGGTAALTTLDVTGDVDTVGVNSDGIVVQSLGGGGGNGALSVAAGVSVAGGASGAVGVGVGGYGGDGGGAGEVQATIVGDVHTRGAQSVGITAQSIGGGGGNGGMTIAGGLNAAGGAGAGVAVGIGGGGANASHGANVTAIVTGNIETDGDESAGLFAQSVGGGGGSGGMNVSGAFSATGSDGGAVAVGVGGSGGGGGNGLEVTAGLTGTAITRGNNSIGVFAQSLGGGGGNGGMNISGAVGAGGSNAGAVSVGVGGSGGGAGTSALTTLTVDGLVATYGHHSGGIVAQSVGGGGGNGGMNISGAAAAAGANGASVAVGVGGAGGGGGTGGGVDASVTGTVYTGGNNSAGITAQSIGGGGGNGALNVAGAISATASSGGSVAVGVGGSGGGAGDGGRVDAEVIDGTVVTEGEASHGVIVQSVGGGGGNGGMNVSGVVAGSSSTAAGIAIGVGGSGGQGGHGGVIEARIESDVGTSGNDSYGVLLQSVGGGGGYGGMNVSGAVSIGNSGGAISVGVGGSGGNAGNGLEVTGTVEGDILTTGDRSIGVLAQSVGGGGGNGGINVSGSMNIGRQAGGAVSIGVGGFGGGGGEANAVTLTRSGATTTDGANAHGVVAQSVGGGGGNGGMNVSGTLALSTSGTAVTASLGLGGFGGDGGLARDVIADIGGDVNALGAGFEGVEQMQDHPQWQRRVIRDGSHGVMAQSVGGAGGNGGMNISGGIALDSNGSSHSITLGVGGFGGAGGNAGTVTLDVDAGLVSAVGDDRYGVIAQSVGGGGGNGGINVAGGIAMDGVVTMGVGGFGGAGGTGNAVNAEVNADISARGLNSIGFLAQSVGGGGGAGGMNVSGGIQGGSDTSTPSLVFGLGGSGGAGNAASTVTATQRGDISVDGVNSIGVLAQSIGGGGGAGALNVSGNLALGRELAASIGIGGDAGTGADAEAVHLTSNGNISARGIEYVQSDQPFDEQGEQIVAARQRTTGIVVQSIGGGGGTGGMNVSGVIAPNGDTLVGGVGGTGAGGGNAGSVTLLRGLDPFTGEISTLDTYGNGGVGILAQSIGGGGGEAGMNFASSVSNVRQNSNAVAMMFAIGGGGGTAGDGETVTITHVGDINTRGARSDGIVAQSIGGGGGKATYNIGLGLNRDATAFNLGIGGATGDGGNADAVTVTHAGNISTQGIDSAAIYAQSVGGGGGDAGFDFVSSPFASEGLDISMGREGGTGGTGGNVTVAANGILTTVGDRSVGVQAQSVGSGGGESSSSSIELSGDGGGEEGHDWSASLEVGHTGGVGGSAGRVEVRTDGGIGTHGAQSHAIHAQSVGGGGGKGGSAMRHGIMEANNQVAVSVGGDGGIGGIGGEVEVENDGVLITRGSDAHGIFAQSIGGGGGVAGHVAIVNVELLGGTGGNSATMSLGGTGGEGSFAQAVDVTNRGEILTLGRRSFGINAQSVGGGGGEGSILINAAVTTGETNRNFNMQVGGDGGIGGTGGAVTVVNEGVIHTLGDESVGVRAQSVGGKGGDAGFIAEFGASVTGNSQQSTRIGVRLGGSGGEGAAGGDVTVTNQRAAGSETGGEILTEGRAAHGIFAQSLGGGGGNGSSVLSANVGGGSGGYTTFVGLNIGGDGGAGGVGGDVAVTNAASIETRDANAHGVYAQSIGGGGGNGGLVLAANAVLAAGGTSGTPLIALGGAGGTGADAGDVVVDNSGDIVTRGAYSHGILAQSIGGGGGNAGIGIGLTTNATDTAIAGALSATFGGRGGHGGIGGHVTVNHSGDITVLGAHSQAVVAESINGGGGHVALDFTGVSTLPGGSTLPGEPTGSPPAVDPIILFRGGGENQSNSNAGRVTLNYTGTFGVAGNNGAANAVQAVGGGGGTYDLSLALVDAAGSADDVTIEGRLGGVDGTNNRGGDIESAHEGDLITEGDNTPGALVQSVGGGGGRANLDLSSGNDSIRAASITLGGENGDTEAGGDIEHTQTGSVSTLGDSAHGGVFQSVGGGGGSLTVRNETSAPATALLQPVIRKAGAAQGSSMRAASVVLAPQLTFGSNGGSGIGGGDLSLGLNGHVRTSGDNAVGMIFQSVGAGGGVANVTGVEGLSIALGGSNGANGDGGRLEVANTGNVLTDGVRSHGVFLQTIGGGGSAVFTDATDPLVSLSADNTGDGGAISFTQNGTIAALGDQAYGLIAQSVAGGGGFVDGGFAGSAGGAGAAGTIVLTLDGDIGALGEGGIALFAQSVGANGLGGDITAGLSAGSLLIGGEDGIAVRYDGGSVNRFDNHGVIRTLSGPLGFAFRGGAGGDFVDNHGVVMGNIDLGGGANGFANNADGTLYSGTSLNLGGPSNVLVNDGIIAPGADGLAVRTALDGSFRQSAGGVSNIEIDYAARDNDRVMATGSAEVGGALNLSLFNVARIQSGVTFNAVYTANGGVTHAGVTLNTAPSVVVSYRLVEYNPTMMGVETNVDFSAAGLLGNRVQMGDYLNRAQRLNVPNGLGDVVTAAVLEDDLDEYAFMLTQLGSEFYAEQQALALNGVQRFARNLQSCGTTSIGADDESCYWIRYDDTPSTREMREGFPAARDDGFSISQGIHSLRDNGWSVGFGVDYQDHRSAGFDGLWTAQSEFIQFGSSLRRDFGAHSVGGTLALGNHAQTVRRTIGVTELYETYGDRDVFFMSSVFDYTYSTTAGGLTFEPSMSLGSSLLNYGGMSEAGADAQNAVIAGGSEGHLWLEPAFALRHDAEFGSGARLRTFVRIGALHYFSGTSTKVRAGLEGGPAFADPARFGSDLDRTHFVGEAGMQYETPGGFNLGFSYSRQESEIREGGAGSLRFMMPLQ